MAGAVTTVRVLIADDERPARRYLAGVLSQCEGAEFVGEAASGFEAVELITTTRPDLALLDLQMPELGGFEVVRRLPRERLPMVAFVTAYDDFAVEAFELSALHYVLKPAQVSQVNDTLARARTLHRRDAAAQATSMAAATATYERLIRRQYLDRIPVRRRDDVVFLQTRQVAFIVAEGELLHLTSVSGNDSRSRIASTRSKRGSTRADSSGSAAAPSSIWISSPASAPCPGGLTARPS